MKIVVLDAYVTNPGDIDWSPIRAMGDLIIYDRTAYQESPLIAKRIGDADIVITSKTPVSKETMDQCPNLKMIALLSTGYNVIDFKYAKKRGIVVSNVPTYGTQIVAQYAISLLLEICMQVGHHNRSVKKGDWENNIDWCYWDYPMIELFQKTAGIIGLGRIGQAIARGLRGLGMHVLAYDTNPTNEGAELATYTDLNTVLGKSDVIFLACPLFDETRGIINKETIAKMKDGVIFINNSRGPLVVEEDLAEALTSGKIYAAGLDVVSSEPIRSDNPLLKLDNCFITPHVSWASKEARQRIFDTTEENIRAFIEGKPINSVY